MSEKKTNKSDLPIGVLFNTINYYQNEDLDKFSSEMTNEQALYCLIQACESAYKRNAFSIVESEILSKAIRKISSPNIEN